MIFKKKQDAAVQQTAAGEAKPAAKGGKAAAFFRKNWKWMVPVVCVAVLGGWFILRPGMNANAEIVVAQAKNTLTVPNAAIVRGGYVLVTQDSPSAVNADPGMIAPDGYVYVPVKTGVSDDNYTQIVSGLTGNDTVAYDSAAASTDTYYDDGGYYEADAEGTEGEEGADAANGMVDEEEPENGTVPAEEPVEAEEKQSSAEDAVNPSQADGVVYLG